MRKTERPRERDNWGQIGAMLPAQLYAEVHALGGPERRLRLAVLADALYQLQRSANATGKRERAMHEAELDWFARDDLSEPFSFVSICDALHLDPEFVRGGLRRWSAAAPFRRTSRRVAARTAVLAGRRSYKGRHGRAA